MCKNRSTGTEAIRRLLFGLIIAAVFILIDQATKDWISRNLSFHESIPVIGNIIRITYTRNPGIAFGISPGMLSGFPLLIVTLIGSIVIAYILVVESRISTIRTAAMGTILGGAVGNLMDRMFHGEVVDFIDIGINSSYRWPVFNIADAAVVAGLGLILLAGKKVALRTEDAAV